ncbi:hypothetical protein V6N13_109692 [Hibiscus sabdariffa]|uniref:Uncharacterized protein n=1 Tax=Hibiscus sabdariffa TaxID=183260 RepID=A0ABR2FQB5_9ROSI
MVPIVVFIYQGMSCVSRNAGKLRLSFDVGCGWTVQVTEVGLGVATTYGCNSQRRRRLHQLNPMASTTRFCLDNVDQRRFW